MPHSRHHGDNSDPEAFAALDELARHGRLFVVRGFDTHAKVVISDRTFACVGSYNWLSFAGAGARHEVSVFLDEPEIVRSEAVSLRRRMEMFSATPRGRRPSTDRRDRGRR
jgi:phosphatidylserine/phosphatidylglycerophosphate/cardiolipin synthase-like enzyme